MMTRGRVATVYGLLAAIFGGHFVDLVTYRDDWPFSNYPMFSSVVSDQLHTFQLTCLYTDPTGTPRESYVDPNWVPSLPQYKLDYVFKSDLDKRDDSRVKLRHLLTDYLAVYNACRQAGLSHGPPLLAVRLYRLDIPLEVPSRRFDLNHDFSKYAKLVLQVDQPAAARTRSPEPVEHVSGS